MSRLKVAAAQIECRPADIAANLALHLSMIDEARGQGIDLLVFPELSLTDYLAAPDLLALSRPRHAPELMQLAEAAGPMAVSVGFIEEDAGARFYNSQGLLRDGQVLAMHRKVNLATYGRLEEGKHFGHGREIADTALSDPWCAVTLICADTWNPALPWLAALGGANFLLVPIASSVDAVSLDFDNSQGWDVNLRHTALTYGLPLVMANHCGARGGLNFWGGSRILDAYGRELGRASATPALIFADLDYEDVRRARAQLPTIRDADPDLVLTLLGRLQAK